MGVHQDVIEAARLVGGREGVPAAVLLAVALVETGGVAFAGAGGRREPLIRFEGHYFDRRLSGEKRHMARLAGLADPRAGKIRNPAAQEARWRMLDRAVSINREAAFASVSWGLCQVMGSHADALGFASAVAMAEMARASAEGQFTIGARFLKQGKLASLLVRGDHAGFARRYNGPGFAANRYDVKIAAAYRRALALSGDAGMAVVAKGLVLAAARPISTA